MDDIVGAISEMLTDKGTDIEVARLPFLPSKVKHRLEGVLRGWRVVVAVGATVSFIVLAANLSLLLWAELVWGSTEAGGVLTIYDGSCSHSNTVFLWSHLAINIIGSLLLACSNAACQCLTAPTRQDIDRMHGRGHYMDVGIPSFRNLFWISKKKKIVWALLISTSVPLHLIYNSVIFGTTTANEYQTVVVTSDFLVRDDLNIQSWDANSAISGPLFSRQESDLETVIADLYANATAVPSRLQRLENAECLNVYSQARVSEYRNVLVVTEGTFPDGSTIRGSVMNDPLSEFQTYWTCIGILSEQVATSPEKFTSNSTYRFDISTSCTVDANQWGLANNFSTDVNEAAWYAIPIAQQRFPLATVDYCLAEKTEPGCTIGLSRSIMIAVIIANAIKFSCFVLVIGWAADEPLVTVGDAISSFLRRPDQTTLNCGPLSIIDVRKGAWPSADYRPRPWTNKRYFWFRAASWKRWTVTSIILLTLYGGGVSCLVLAMKFTGTVVTAWNLGFGSVNVRYVLRIPFTSSLTGAVLLANTPQLLLSFCYVFFNNILTSCLLAAEYADYVIHRKPLRVTTGKKSQRSTYWLQLPYRFAVPLLVTFTGVHWLISQSIFLARIKGYSYLGYRRLEGVDTYCGYSPIAVLFTVAFAGLLILGFFAIGFRKFPKGIPVVGSCSAAIASACHAGLDEGQDMVEWPLQYGVLKGRGTRRKLFRRRTTGFTEGTPETINDVSMLKTKVRQMTIRSLGSSSVGASSLDSQTNLGTPTLLPPVGETEVPPLPSPIPAQAHLDQPHLPPSHVEAYVWPGPSPGEELANLSDPFLQSPHHGGEISPCPSPMGLRPPRLRTRRDSEVSSNHSQAGSATHLLPWSRSASVSPGPSATGSRIHLLPPSTASISPPSPALSQRDLPNSLAASNAYEAGETPTADAPAPRVAHLTALRTAMQGLAVFLDSYLLDRPKATEPTPPFDLEEVQKYPRVGFSSLDVEPLVDGVYYR